MYKQNKMKRTNLKVNTSVQGEPIEAKVRRIMNNKEPITDGAPLIYTDRKKGVLKEMDIRHDKWETAVEGHAKVRDLYQSARDERFNERPEEKAKAEAAKNKKDGGTESTHTTT